MRTTQFQWRPIAVAVSAFLAIQVGAGLPVQAESFLKNMTGKVNRAADRADKTADTAKQKIDAVDRRINSERQKVQDLQDQADSLRQSLEAWRSVVDSVAENAETVGHMVDFVDPSSHSVDASSPQENEATSPPNTTGGVSRTKVPKVRTLSRVPIKLGAYDFAKQRFDAEVAIATLLPTGLACPPQLLTNEEFQLWRLQATEQPAAGPLRCALACAPAQALRLVEAENAGRLRCEITFELTTAGVATRQGGTPLHIVHPLAICLLDGETVVLGKR